MNTANIVRQLDEDNACDEFEDCPQRLSRSPLLSWGGAGAGAGKRDRFKGRYEAGMASRVLVALGGAALTPGPSP